MRVNELTNAFNCTVLLVVEFTYTLNRAVPIVIELIYAYTRIAWERYRWILHVIIRQ